TARSAPLADTLRVLPTSPPLASSALRCVEFAGPLSKSLLGKSKVFPIRCHRQPLQIPATRVGAPHHDQAHLLTRTKAQPLRGTEHTILVLAFNDSADVDLTMRWWE